jgi:hypothetical protein
MSAQNAAALPARPMRFRLGRRGVAALVVLAAAALAAGLVVGLGGDSHGSRAHARVNEFRAADGSFRVSYPAGWKATAIGSTAAVIQRSDRNGLVLVRERPALKGTLSSLVKNLPSELRKRFPDFHPVGASVAKLATGPAVVYTFVRAKAGKVQTIVIAPTARRSYTLEVVAPGKARDAVRQAGGIVRSLQAR